MGLMVFGVRRIINQMSDENFSVKINAAEKLERIRFKNEDDKRAAIEVLIGANGGTGIRDENSFVRGRSARTLKEIGDGSAIPALIEMADNEEELDLNRSIARDAVFKISAREKITFTPDVERIIEERKREIAQAEQVLGEGARELARKYGMQPATAPSLRGAQATTFRH